MSVCRGRWDGADLKGRQPERADVIGCACGYWRWLAGRAGVSRT